MDTYRDKAKHNKAEMLCITSQQDLEYLRERMSFLRLWTPIIASIGTSVLGMLTARGKAREVRQGQRGEDVWRSVNFYGSFVEFFRVCWNVFLKVNFWRGRLDTSLVLWKYSLSFISFLSMFICVCFSWSLNSTKTWTFD